jgi:hypothetical protein
MIDPILAAELDALPLRVLIASRRSDGRGRILGVPCLSAGQTTDHPVVLAHKSCVVLVLAAYTAEEFALFPKDADRACAARVNAALGYTHLQVVRVFPTVPARLDRWQSTYGHPIPYAFRDLGDPHTVCDATHEIPTSSYVAKDFTVIDFRDGKRGIRWHLPYTTPLRAEVNQSAIVPRPKPGAPIEVIREIIPAAVRAEEQASLPAMPVNQPPAPVQSQSRVDSRMR